MLKQAVKKMLFNVAPKMAETIQRKRARDHVRRLEERIGLTRVRDEFVKQHGLVVLDGPFAGMKYIDSTTGSVAVPKLVGSYEAELHPWIEDALRCGYERVVDVGSAEGYYAVGFARAIASAEVYAFDTDPLAQQLCGEMARLNDVADRVRIFGACDATRLDELLTAKCLIVCDCEGFEVDLLDPARAPRLAGADMIVELHDGVREGTTQILRQRFAGTHGCAMVKTALRDPKQYGSVQFLAAEDRALALSEMRSWDQEWALFTAKR